MPPRPLRTGPPAQPVASNPASDQPPPNPSSSVIIENSRAPALELPVLPESVDDVRMGGDRSEGAPSSQPRDQSVASRDQQRSRIPPASRFAAGQDVIDISDSESISDSDSGDRGPASRFAVVPSPVIGMGDNGSNSGDDSSAGEPVNGRRRLNTGPPALISHRRGWGGTNGDILQARRENAELLNENKSLRERLAVAQREADAAQQGANEDTRLLRAQLDNVSALRDTAVLRVGDLERSNSENSALVASLRARLASVERAVETSNARVTVFETRLTEVSAELTTARLQNAELVNRVAAPGTVEAAFARVREDTAATVRAESAATIAELRARVAALSDEIRGMREAAAHVPGDSDNSDSGSDSDGIDSDGSGDDDDGAELDERKQAGVPVQDDLDEVEMRTVPLLENAVRKFIQDAGVSASAAASQSPEALIGILRSMASEQARLRQNDALYRDLDMSTTSLATIMGTWLDDASGMPASDNTPVGTVARIRYILTQISRFFSAMVSKYIGLRSRIPSLANDASAVTTRGVLLDGFDRAIDAVDTLAKNQATLVQGVNRLYETVRDANSPDDDVSTNPIGKLGIADRRYAGMRDSVRAHTTEIARLTDADEKKGELLAAAKQVLVTLETQLNEFVSPNQLTASTTIVDAVRSINRNYAAIREKLQGLNTRLILPEFETAVASESTLASFVARLGEFIAHATRISDAHRELTQAVRAAYNVGRDAELNVEQAQMRAHNAGVYADDDDEDDSDRPSLTDGVIPMTRLALAPPLASHRETVELLKSIERMDRRILKFGTTMLERLLKLDSAEKKSDTNVERVMEQLRAVVDELRTFGVKAPTEENSASALGLIKYIDSATRALMTSINSSLATIATRVPRNPDPTSTTLRQFAAYGTVIATLQTAYDELTEGVLTLYNSAPDFVENRLVSAQLDRVTRVRTGQISVDRELVNASLADLTTRNSRTVSTFNRLLGERDKTLDAIIKSSQNTYNEILSSDRDEDDDVPPAVTRETIAAFIDTTYNTAVRLLVARLKETRAELGRMTSLNARYVDANATALARHNTDVASVTKLRNDLTDVRERLRGVQSDDQARSLAQMAYITSILADTFVMPKGRGDGPLVVVSAMMEVVTTVNRKLDANGDLLRMLAGVEAMPRPPSSIPLTRSDVSVVNGSYSVGELDIFKELCICTGLLKLAPATASVSTAAVDRVAEAVRHANERNVMFDPMMFEVVRRALASVRMAPAAAGFLFSTDRIRQAWTAVIEAILTAIAPAAVFQVALDQHMTTSTKAIVTALENVVKPENFVGFELGDSMGTLQLSGEPVTAAKITALIRRATVVNDILNAAGDLGVTVLDGGLERAVGIVNRHCLDFGLMFNSAKVQEITASLLRDIRDNDSESPLVALIEVVRSILNESFSGGDLARSTSTAKVLYNNLVKYAEGVKDVTDRVVEAIDKFTISRLPDADNDIERLARVVTELAPNSVPAIVRGLLVAQASGGRSRGALSLAIERIGTELASAREGADSTVRSTIDAVFADGVSPFVVFARVLASVNRYAPPDLRPEDAAQMKRDINLLIGAAPLRAQLLHIIRDFPGAYRNSAFFGEVARNTQTAEYLDVVSTRGLTAITGGNITATLECLVQMMAVYGNRARAAAGSVRPSVSQIGSGAPVSVGASAAASAQSSASSDIVARNANGGDDEARLLNDARLSMVVAERFNLFVAMVVGRYPGPATDIQDAAGHDVQTGLSTHVAVPDAARADREVAYSAASGAAYKYRKVGARGFAVPSGPSAARGDVAEMQQSLERMDGDSDVHTHIDAARDRIGVDVGAIAARVEAAARAAGAHADASARILSDISVGDVRVLAGRYANGPAPAIEDVRLLHDALRTQQTAVRRLTSELNEVHGRLPALASPITELSSMMRVSRTRRMGAPAFVRTCDFDVAKAQLLGSLSSRARAAYMAVVYYMRDQGTCAWVTYPFSYHIMSEALLVPLASRVALGVWETKNPEVRRDPHFFRELCALNGILANIAISPYGRLHPPSVETTQLPVDIIDGNGVPIDPFVRVAVADSVGTVSQQSASRARRWRPSL